MNLSELRRNVWEANMALCEHGLVRFNWGNVSGIDREHGVVVIKPSGLPYPQLSPENMVVLDLDGNILEGELRPSTDTPTHLALYRGFPEIGGVCHTHSMFATARAQAGLALPCYGTTHADCFCGTVPCTLPMTPEEIAGDYETETVAVISRAFRDTDPRTVRAVLVRSHGPFTWGDSAADAEHNAAYLEFAAECAFYTERFALGSESSAAPIDRELLDRHYLRKHGSSAYYGQK